MKPLLLFFLTAVLVSSSTEPLSYVTLPPSTMSVKQLATFRIGFVARFDNQTASMSIIQVTFPANTFEYKGFDASMDGVTISSLGAVTANSSSVVIVWNPLNPTSGVLNASIRLNPKSTGSYDVNWRFILTGISKPPQPPTFQDKRGVIKVGVVATPNVPPIAEAGRNQIAKIGGTVAFNGSASTDSDGRIVSYAWAFGDGSTGTGVRVNHVYERAGNFTVRLTVMDDRGGFGNDTLRIEVKNVSNLPPTAVISCGHRMFTSQSITFNGCGSSDGDGSVVEYRWDFGDGSSGSGSMITHSFVDSGEYTITLTVVDDKGAVGSTTTVVAVEKPPVTPLTSLQRSLEEGALRVVDDSGGTGVVLKANATGRTSVYLIQYHDNPYPQRSPTVVVGKCVDVSIENPENVTWPVYVELHYLDSDAVGLSESSFKLFYYNGTCWNLCSDCGVNTAENVVWAHLTKAELSGSPLLIGVGLKPASVQIGGLSVKPSQVFLGDAATADVLVENAGDLEGEYNISLLVNGTVSAQKFGVISPRNQTTLTFKLTLPVGYYDVQVGNLTQSLIVSKTPTPATFTYSNLAINPQSPQLGEVVSVTVSVSNAGETGGEVSVRFLVDSVEQSIEKVQLSGGASTTVSFNWTPDNQGYHLLSVDVLSSEVRVQEGFPTPLLGIMVVGVTLLAASIGLFFFYSRKRTSSTSQLSRLVSLFNV